MRRTRALALVFLFVLVACGGAAWDVANAPKTPPDEQFRTGVEAGEDVYLWHCYEGHRVMVSQFGSACFGSRKPVVERGPCGAPLPGEQRFGAYEREAGAERLPDSQRWPGSPKVEASPMDASLVDAAADR